MIKAKRKFIRVDGRLRELVTVSDEKGKILHKILNPVMLEFYPRDIIQVIVGASILAVPVAFTEETWKLGSSLALSNVIMLFLISLIFISLFVYYNYYRNKIKEHKNQFLKRVLSTYILSFVVASLILSLIGKWPLVGDTMLAIKRSIIVSFPASMSAAISDIVK